MTRFVLFSLALIAAAPVAAQHQPTAPAAAKPATDTPSPKLQNLLESCDAHKFETTIEAVVDGTPHRSKVKLCGTEGQSDSDWIGTLKDAIAKLEANKEMAPALRDQIVTAIRAEIVHLESSDTKSAGTEPAFVPRRLEASPEPLTSDYSALPPLPTAPTTPPPSLLGESPGGKALETSSIAPAPAPPPAAAAPSAQPPVAKPRLAFSCISPEYPAGGECISLSRETILNVKAAEALPAGVSVRFLRQGQAHGEIDLGSMRSGQSTNLALPRQLCSGVVSSEVEMRVFRGGQSVERLGPYLLRC